MPRRIIITESQVGVIMGEGWKQAALGGLMGLSVMSGMQSCGNMVNHNATQKEWCYDVYQGGTFEASMCKINDKKYVVDLQIDMAKYDSYDSEGHRLPAWGKNSANPPMYQTTKKRGDLLVDVYFTKDVSYEGYNMACYIELYYTKDERLPMNDRAQYIKVYHTNSDRNESEFTITIDKIRDIGVTRFDISNNYQ